MRGVKDKLITKDQILERKSAAEAIGELSAAQKEYQPNLLASLGGHPSISVVTCAATERASPSRS